MAIPREKTELENYLVYGIDPKNRRIFFGHPLDWGELEDMDLSDLQIGSVELAIRAIKRMEKDHPKHTIELYMHSYGGATESMIYLHDIILASDCKFVFYGGGVVQSSASYIMCICDERYLYPNARIMVHHGSDSFRGNWKDFEIYFKDAKELNNFCNTIYAENSHMPVEFWNKICERDLSLSSEEAIKLGLADFLVPRPKRGNLRKKREAKMRTIDPGIKKLVQQLYERVDIYPKKRTIEVHIPEEAAKDANVVVNDSPIETADEKKDG